MRITKQQRKDLVALLVICYMLPFCFWFANYNNIYTKFDWYLFVSSLSVMLIVPIFVFEYKYRLFKKGGL